MEVNKLNWEEILQFKRNCGCNWETLLERYKDVYLDGYVGKLFRPKLTLTDETGPIFHKAQLAP